MFVIHDQLQTIYTNLAIEKDHVETNYKSLTVEKDGLQRKLSYLGKQTHLNLT